ncbi:tandem-95 repeat protein, partial [bacterium]|nr:tandem-95 repeat protein [bacterium]
TVNAVNDAPTLAEIADRTTDEDTPLTGIALTLADVDSTLTCSTALSVTSSSNTTLLPTSGVTFAGTGTSCTMSLTPVANGYGTSDVTIQVSDGSLTASRTFKLTVNSVNDEPTISAIASQIGSEDTPKAVNFTLNDVDGPLDCTSSYLTALSTDPSKVANTGAVAFTGTYPHCTATITPVANANGPTFITILVTDGTSATALSSSRTFQMTFLPVNDAPVLTTPGTQTTNEDQAITFNVSLYDVDNTLSCSGYSNASTPYLKLTPADLTLLPLANISVSQVSSSAGTVVCAVTATPASNQFGSTAVAVEISDGVAAAVSGSFNFTVTKLNDAPTMTSIASQSTTEDVYKDISFTLADVDGDLDCSSTYLSYSSADSNKVAATGAVTWSGTYPNCSARVTPVANANGQVSLTFTVNDGGNGNASGVSGSLSASRTFTLTIDAANDAPSITIGALPSVSEDPVTAPVVPFTLADIDGDLACSTTYLSYVSLDSSKIAATGAVTFSDTWPNCKATIVLQPNANGVASIQITVSDNGNGGIGGAMNATALVSLNVTPVNDAPTGAVSCETLSSGNVFKTGFANGGSWALGTCTGASDVDGDALTYKLEYVETGATSSSSYPCPTNLASSSGGSSISGNFPSGSGVYGSCRYKLKACDSSNECTALSSNSVIISSYELTVGSPTTPTLNNSCLVETSATISGSANLSSISWQANTSAPGSSASTGSISASSGVLSGTASFSTDITSQLLSSTFMPSTPTKATTIAGTTASISVSQGTLLGATANPPSGQITSSASNSSSYVITRTLEALAVRQGGSSGAASTFAETHSDGQQVDFASPAGCRACTNNAIVSISAGDKHTCVVESTGTTKCWGASASGALGIGTATYSQYALPQAIVTTNISSFTHTMVAAGSEFTCLMGTTTNKVTCWGKNSTYQLGRGTSSTTNVLAPSSTTVANLSDPIAISASKSGGHACAINSSGNVYCWGSSSSGQLGNNSTASTQSAVQVVLAGGSTALPFVRSIAAGGSHTCAALSYNSSYTAGIYCWGSNSNGQLGDSSTTNRNVATPVDTTNQGSTSSGTWFTQVVAGTSHSCALRNDGAVFCWGANSFGQLGDNSTTERTIPTAVNSLGAGSGVVSLTAGHNHTCALKNDHSVHCWGKNEFGQLGDASTTQRLVPTQAIASSSSNSALALSAGGNHTCAVLLDGTVKCWGAGDSGQLGNDTTSAASDNGADDCDAESGTTLYCSKSPALVNWSSGVTSNSTLRPKSCHHYTIP